MQRYEIKRNTDLIPAYGYQYDDAFGNALGNSIVRAARSGNTNTTSSADPDTGKFSPVEQFDPQAAYLEQQRKNMAVQAAENLTHTTATTQAFDFDPVEFDFSLSLSNDDVSEFFQHEHTRALQQRLADEQFAISNLANSMGPHPLGGVIWGGTNNLASNNSQQPGPWRDGYVFSGINQKLSSFDLGKALSDYGTLSTAYSLGYETLKQVPYVDEVINTMRAVPEAVINPTMDIELPKGSSGFIDGIGKGFFWLQTAYEVPKFFIDEGSYAFENKSFRMETLTKGADLAVTTGLGYAATVNPWIGVPALAWTFKSEIHDAAIKGHQLQVNDIKNNPTQFPIRAKF